MHVRAKRELYLWVLGVLRSTPVVCVRGAPSPAVCGLLQLCAQAGFGVYVRI